MGTRVPDRAYYSMGQFNMGNLLKLDHLPTQFLPRNVTSNMWIGLTFLCAACPIRACSHKQGGVRKGGRMEGAFAQTTRGLVSQGGEAFNKEGSLCPNDRRVFELGSFVDQMTGRVLTKRQA